MNLINIKMICMGLLMSTLAQAKEIQCSDGTFAYGVARLIANAKGISVQVKYPSFSTLKEVHGSIASVLGVPNLSIRDVIALEVSYPNAKLFTSLKDQVLINSMAAPNTPATLIATIGNRRQPTTVTVKLNQFMVRTRKIMNPMTPDQTLFELLMATDKNRSVVLEMTNEGEQACRVTNP